MKKNKNEFIKEFVEENVYSNMTGLVEYILKNNDLDNNRFDSKAPFSMSDVRHAWEEYSSDEEDGYTEYKYDKVTSWVLVSAYLAEELDSLGEVVIMCSPYNFWGRRSCNIGYEQDGIIINIANKCYE